MVYESDNAYLKVFLVVEHTLGVRITERKTSLRSVFHLINPDIPRSIQRQDNPYNMHYL